jgi:hypothetical protein
VVNIITGENTGPGRDRKESWRSTQKWHVGWVVVDNHKDKGDEGLLSRKAEFKKDLGMGQNLCVRMTSNQEWQVKEYRKRIGKGRGPGLEELVCVVLKDMNQRHGIVWKLWLTHWKWTDVENYFRGVLVFWSYHDKLPQTWWFTIQV